VVNYFNIWHITRSSFDLFCFSFKTVRLWHWTGRWLLECV